MNDIKYMPYIKIFVSENETIDESILKKFDVKESI